MILMILIVMKKAMLLVTINIRLKEKISTEKKKIRKKLKIADDEKDIFPTCHLVDKNSCLIEAGIQHLKFVPQKMQILEIS